MMDPCKTNYRLMYNICDGGAWRQRVASGNRSIVRIFLGGANLCTLFLVYYKDSADTTPTKTNTCIECENCDTPTLNETAQQWAKVADLYP